jgi:hypothetical protein
MPQNDENEAAGGADGKTDRRTKTEKLKSVSPDIAKSGTA